MAKNKVCNTPQTDFSSPFQRGDAVVYDKNAQVCIGAVLDVAGKGVQVLNSDGGTTSLPAKRLEKVVSLRFNIDQGVNEIRREISSIRDEARVQAETIDLKKLWEEAQVIDSDNKGLTVKELCELYFDDVTPINYVSLRIALNTNKTYFKRKDHIYFPRDEEAVKELEKAFLREKAEEEVVARFISAVKEGRNIKEEGEEGFSDIVRMLEDLAGIAKEPLNQGRAKELIGRIYSELKWDSLGSLQERAIKVLTRVGLFGPTTNIMIFRYRPEIEFSKEELQEARNLYDLVIRSNNEGREDLRFLKTITIDDVTTKDMDDAISIERIEGGFRLGIHVSDIASFIQPASLLDKTARRRGTSIYLPEQTIHMFPTLLSEDAFSLREGETRNAVSCLIDLSAELEVLDFEIKLTKIRVGKRYTYDQVDSLLSSGWKEVEGEALSSDSVSERAQLGLLRNIADYFVQARQSNGALVIPRKDISVQVLPDGTITRRETDEGSPARSLISELMITYNVFIANYASERGIPMLYRSQEEPDVDTDEVKVKAPVGLAHDYNARSGLRRSEVKTKPAFHSSLGVNAYLQVTSPIRRYLDLCLQRQLVAHLRKEKLPYSEEDLLNIYYEVGSSLGRAKSLSDDSKRYWLYKSLLQEGFLGREIKCTVLRNDLRNPLVYLNDFHFTAIVHTRKTVSVGEVIEAKITRIDLLTPAIKLEY